ncbi:CopG family transcriptional regulator [Thiothrix nivea DSM 5205]|uniref:CopG family transcriptional regulator n=2 Tax=Thiothrix nivea TaxID=1031 RepID=A0A656HD46_THINJ|nr:CopG family transcriptional regulator [Thiothrix nivea DSM 5205]
MLNKGMDMRTTIQLDNHLHEMARQYALATGKTFAALVEEALREKLMSQAAPKPRMRVKLTTVKGKGIRHGVDLDSNAALLDLMEAD